MNLRELRVEEQGNIKVRVTIVFAVTVLLFVVIAGRLFEKQILKYGHYQGLAYNQRYREQKIRPARGNVYVTDIYSDSKYPLVTNKTFWSVMLIPEQITDPVGIANSVGSIIGIPPEDITKLLAEKKVYIPPLKKKLSDEETAKLQQLKIDGLVLIPETYRDYPEGSMGAPFLGFVDNEGEGQYGIEQGINGILKGEDGKLISERDILGRQITVADSKLILPKSGKDVVLTIDRVIQFIAEKEVKDAVIRHSADSASVVVMDPKSGGILALAEYPTYDPAKFTEVTDYKLFQCMAVSDAYEPGSVFKALAMAAGIDSGVVTPDTGEYFDAKIQVEDAVIWNSVKKAYGYETMTQVLENSDNVGMVWMINKVGMDRYYKYLDTFGFGRPTGIELSNESSGIIRDKDDAILVDLATMSFGQGINTTELQLVQALSAVANDGLMVQPHIVKEYIDKNGKVQKVESKIVGRVFKEDTARDIGKMLVSVVERGHGKQAIVKGYRIGGKTGTAQIPLKNGVGYETDKFTGSFLGYGPIDDPAFVMLTRINVPRDVIWAESTAAPIFGNIAKQIINYYQLTPDLNWADEQTKRQKGQIK